MAALRLFDKNGFSQAHKARRWLCAYPLAPCTRTPQSQTETLTSAPPSPCSKRIISAVPIENGILAMMPFESFS